MTTALQNLESRLRNCRGVLVDSNVLLDIATNDARWADWSARALAECADAAALIINPIVYAEVSIGFSTIEALDGALPLAERALLVSGRLSFEIVLKALAAHIPVVAAVSAPSSLAVELAEAGGITLVGFLRGRSLNVYTHPRRVRSE